MTSSSMDQRQLERRARELKMNEDKVARMEQQVRRNDERVRERAREIEERGKTYVAKEKTLREKEAKVDKRARLIEDEKRHFVEEKEEWENGRKARLMIVVPVLLIAAIGAGYLVFEFKAQDNYFYDQFKVASDNIEKINNAYNELDQQKLAVEAQLADQKKVVEELRKEVADKASAFEKVSGDKRTLQTKYDEVRTRMLAGEKKSQVLEGDKERLRDELTRLATEKDGLNEDIASLEFKLSAIGSQLLTSQEALTATEANLQNANAVGQTQLKELEESRELNRQLQKELDGLIARFEQQKVMLGKVENEKAASQGSAAEKDQQIVDLNARIEALNNELSSKVDVVSAKEALLAELQSYADVLEGKVGNLEKALAAEKSISTSLEEQVKSLEKELQAGVEALQSPQ